MPPSSGRHQESGATISVRLKLAPPAIAGEAPTAARSLCAGSRSATFTVTSTAMDVPSGSQSQLGCASVRTGHTHPRNLSCPRRCPARSGVDLHLKWGRQALRESSGAGVQNSCAFFGQVAHLHPAEFFTVVAGITEFFGAVAVGLGSSAGSRRSVSPATWSWR
jgi:hypothetical protein